VILLVVLVASASGVTWLAVYLWQQGLDRADKLGSAVGLFVGIAALLLTAVGVWRAWSTRSVPQRAVPAPRGEAGDRSRAKVATFDVVAHRDAYNAQDMTVVQRSDGDAPIISRQDPTAPPEGRAQHDVDPVRRGSLDG